MVLNGSRREWTTHTAFLGKSASNLSSFRISAQYLTVAHPPGMGVSFLAYTQPQTNLWNPSCHHTAVALLGMSPEAVWNTVLAAQAMGFSHAF